MKNSLLYIDLIDNKSLPSMESLQQVKDLTSITKVTSSEEAISLLSTTKSYNIVICNNANYQIFKSARNHNPNTSNILVTESPMVRYSADLKSEENILCDHIIVNRADATKTINEVNITLKKLLTKDIFGIEKYLMSDTLINTETVTGSADREKFNIKLLNFAKQCHLGQHTAKTVFGISEELLMNAIYDAPTTDNRPRYINVSRSEPIVLAPNEYATLTYGCDSKLFAVGISDPFGALTKEKLFYYLKKVLKRKNSSELIDTKKGGAGLGFFKILYSSHYLICNIQEHQRTQIISILDMKEPIKDFAFMPRSIHYFQV